MKFSHLKGSLILVLTAVIWGSAFVAQSVSTGFIGTFTFNFLRSVLAMIVLLPVIFISDKIKARENKINGIVPASADRKKSGRTLLTAGVICGVILFLAMALQQEGLKYTTAGKAAFITTLYIVFVPIVGMFIGKKPGMSVWIAVTIAALGAYLLCISESFSIGFGDFLVFLCAVCYSAHILVVDRFVDKIDGVQLSFVQFAVVAVLSVFPMFIAEKPDFVAISGAWLPVAYAGIMSSGVAYTLQIVGQKYTPVSIAPLIMSLESVFGAVFGALLLHEVLSDREILGCILIFIAVILAQTNFIDIALNRIFAKKRM